LHPAYSVIVFTTLSGAGYGLLIWLAVARLTGALDEAWLAALAGLALAVVLITAGLLSSSLHLGHPERAWRAFSQWRSSWLSREGVAAVATYVPIGLLGLDWLLAESASLQSYAFAVASIAGALVTVWCTGMIYACLRTIPEWHEGLVAPIYIALALAAGGALFALFHTFAPAGGRIAAVLALAFVLVAAAMKIAYWRRIDGLVPQYTAAQALGLPNAGAPRQLDAPHSRPNFVQREMGYRVGRKHAEKLRVLALALIGAVPAAGLIVLAFGPPQPWAAMVAALAGLSFLAGTMVERWLFFAQARHVSMLYYGAAEI